MAPTKKKQNKGGVLAAEIGAGVLAAAAAGAGYYFYGAKGAKKHRQAASSWAKGMKTRVVKDAKAVAKLDKKVMGAIVDRAATAYVTARNVKREDVMAAAKELKANWQEIQKELGTAAKKGARSVSKPVKKAAKKVTKKSAPKKAAKKNVTKKKK
jgi:hypothetical protein